MKYLAFYDVTENKEENRNYVLAATNKMKYILECVEDLHIPCKVISASTTNGKKIYKSKKIQISDNVQLILPFTLGKANKIIAILDRWQIKIRLLLELLKTKKSETVIVYHSLYYMPLVALAKKIKKFRLILEVEEIYGDVIEKENTSKKELEFFKKADAYIFPTELLDKKVNTENKPSVIIYGTYGVEKEIGAKANDNKIHVVYAGTLDPRKGGITAVKTAEFLNSGYHIHILGFGNDRDKEILLQEIDRVKKLSDCEVSFDGLLTGEEYTKFIQSCDIGLCPQNPDAKFTNTSFPSKTLSYMSNGLRVVSIKIPSMEQSKIGEYLYFYNEQAPETIAETIKKIDLKDNYDSRSVISRLDREFREKIKQLL